jgi:hypothetical protein
MDDLQIIMRAETAASRALDVPDPRRALVVLGMSRSGTSLLTHILHTLGARLPADLIGATHGNPLGHWEPRALVAINDAILLKLNRRWDDPRPIPEAWFRGREAYGFLQRIMAEITSGFGDAPLLVLKDPRVCRLLPLYLEAFDVLGIDPLVVLQVRPMMAVARSLADRDELDPSHSELLWLRSLVEAEWHSRCCARVWVGFEQLIADWRQSIDRIGATLGVSWPVDPDDATPLIGPVLKPRLNHGSREIVGATKCIVGMGSHQPLSGQAWAAVAHGLAANELAAQAGFDAVRATLEDFDRMYEPFLTSIAQRHEAAFAAIRSSTCWRITAPLRALKGRWRGDGSAGDGSGGDGRR